ncbi:MAG: T9SS type A sorting domain-containing protein [Bacteroidales bacterium]|nr:T9SS type A sorting domain-containing protein [Bacteroidales bacterium]
MKHLFLSLIVLGFLFAGYSQSRIPADKELTKMSLTRKFDVPADIPPPMLNPIYIAPGKMKDARLLGDETEIIETVFDLQSNSSLANRFLVWEDGTMAATCIRGVENPTNNAFPDRGTGYNYFDGISWGPKPTARIETVRTGWPSIAPLGPNGEIVVAHVSGTAPMIVNYRATKGTGAWTQTEFAPAPAGSTGLLWPRVVTSGPDNNIVHVFVMTAPSGNGGTPYLGQDGALLYYRSSDAGQTWDIQAELIDGLGSDFYTSFSSDNYALASKGDMVVMLHGSAWSDMFILKSMDNGETWEKTIIWEHPYPFFDFNTTLMDDTLYACDNSANMAIDNNGMVHVVWGVGRVARLAAAPPDPGFYSYWPYTDGIGYWNESMGQIPEADNPHHTMMPENLEELGMLIGWTQDVNNSGFIFDFEGTAETPFNVYRSLGISCMPTIAIYDNYIALVYSSVTETFVTADGTMNYKHLWLRQSYDLGQTWGDFLDMNADNIFHLYDECIYPVLADKPDPGGSFNLIYNADNIPGIYAFDGDHDPVINRIIHNRLWWLVGIDSPEQNNSISVAQNYPNPATGITQINVILDKPALVGLEIINATGQKVVDIPAINLQQGSHNLSFDASVLKPGVYFYTVTTGSEKVSKKMVVK